MMNEMLSKGILDQIRWAKEKREAAREASEVEVEVEVEVEGGRGQFL